MASRTGWALIPSACSCVSTMRRRNASKSCAVVAPFDPVTNAVSAPNILNAARGISRAAQQPAESLLQLLLGFLGRPIGDRSLRHIGHVDLDAEVVGRSRNGCRQRHAPLLRSVPRQIASCL